MPRPPQQAEYERFQKVVAAVDLAGVPAGTKGKVLLVNGIRWVRYWVRFDNGVELGRLGSEHLTTPDRWDELQAATARRDRAALAARRRQDYLSNIDQAQAS